MSDAKENKKDIKVANCFDPTNAIYEDHYKEILEDLNVEDKKLLLKFRTEAENDYKEGKKIIVDPVARFWDAIGSTRPDYREWAHVTNKHKDVIRANCRLCNPEYHYQ
jgi:hypothetical protein